VTGVAGGQSPLAPRRALTLAAAVVAALAVPAAGFAHATMQASTPGVQGRVEKAPRAIILEFDQAVTATDKSIEVRTAKGRLVSKPATQGPDHRYVLARLAPNLPRGAYTVRWSALSADGHVGSGVFTFGVRVAAPPPTEAYGASGPSASDDIIRWVLFASLALLLGGLGLRLIALRGAVVPARAARRLTILTAVGVVATLEAGIAGFIMRAEDALQLPFDRLLYGDLSPIAGGTRFGQAFIVMTLGYAAVAALLYLAWLTDRDLLLWPGFAIALGMAGGLSLSGHSALEPNSTWLSQLADWVHLCAAAIWAGGLVALAVCVWPVAPELRRQAFLGFSRLATVLIGLLLAAGVYLSVLRLPTVSDLWEASYGRVLLVKLALVGVALCWGAVHHFLVRPRLERGAAGGGRIRRSLVAESAVGMAVLLAAAVLVNSAPPPEPQQAPAQAASVRP
jgi:copper transport protein